METREERYQRYLKQNKGVWFASCPDMKEWAEEKVKSGQLKPMSSLFNYGTNNWYVLSDFIKSDCLKYFKANGLAQLFGCHEFCLEFFI